MDYINDIKGNPKGPKGQIFFQVHWVGVENPTWEPGRVSEQQLRYMNFYAIIVMRQFGDFYLKNIKILVTNINKIMSKQELSRCLV